MLLDKADPLPVIDTPPELYFKHLKTINAVHFTPREIDIITFFISGRSMKKIATFLNISPKTVAYHTNNIMQKLRSHSREEIIDFIEKSPHASLLRQYHTSLFNQALFEEILKDIAGLTQETTTCLITYLAREKPPDYFLKELARHLAITKVKTTTEAMEDNQYIKLLTSVQKIIL